MPRSLDNMQEYVDLPSNYKYSFKIQPSGYLKISAMVPEWGFVWSILCRPVLAWFDMIKPENAKNLFVFRYYLHASYDIYEPKHILIKLNKRPQ